MALDKWESRGSTLGGVETLVDMVGSCMRVDVVDVVSGGHHGSLRSEPSGSGGCMSRILGTQELIIT
jgi:hypothetical protein